MHTGARAVTETRYHLHVRPWHVALQIKIEVARLERRRVNLRRCGKHQQKRCDRERSSDDRIAPPATQVVCPLQERHAG
jgi:hypothetical protein